MLITITYEGTDGTQTQDLGYLLHKNPYRAQAFHLHYGSAYVFYPEVSDERTTAALLLDIDPIVLARGKLGSKDGGLFDYVNDRPYVASSFMSNAISRVFGTAMSGRCDKRPALAQTPLPLAVCIYNLRDGGHDGLAKELFEPLGYTVTTEREVLDERFPAWGMSPYITLTLQGCVKLSELLNHLYVLMPVFDRQKHYYISEDEVQKLLSHGEGWLAAHPAKDKIIMRYLYARRSYARKAIGSLTQSPDAEEALDSRSDETVQESAASAPAADKEPHPSLNTRRLQAVRQAVLDSGAVTVIDIGCGEGRLTALLLGESQIQKMTACDVSVRVLEKAAQKLRLEQMPSYRKNKLTLMQASLTYRDKRFEGYDCACVVEVIEHIDPMRLPALEQVLFGFAAPKTVILTTPNREYNAHYPTLPQDALRHGDHRFEWTRAEFATWTQHVCETFGYDCRISEIGDRDDTLGAPTQMGVFTKHG